MRDRNTYRFGDFEVDSARRSLMKNDELVPLSNRAFDLLLVLIENRERVMTKDDLIELVWDGHFVEENNITVQVSALRKTLGDDARSPEFLKTFPGYGYRFIAEVDTEDEGMAGVSPGPSRAKNYEVPLSAAHRAKIEPSLLRSPASRAGLRKPQVFAIGAIAAVAVAGLLAWRFAGSAESSHNVSNQMLLSNFPGSHSSASFSPAGDRIVFVNATDGDTQIWLKDLSGPGSAVLVSNFGTLSRPRWSPDGEEIAFTRELNGKTDVYLVSAAGGIPKVIIDSGRNPDWSWDGRRIVFERGYDIWMANKDGSGQERVEGLPQTDLLLADRMPALSPDGKLIAFFQNDKSPKGDYFVINIEEGNLRKLTNDRAFGGAPVWHPDGEYLIFPSFRGGSKTLWRVGINDGEPEPLLSSVGEDSEPQVTRDGKRLIFANTKKRYSLMITDPENGKDRVVRESRFHIVNPSFSPDGLSIAYFGINEVGDIQIHRINKDGTGHKSVTSGKREENIHPQWSPDGKSIYYYNNYPDPSYRSISAKGGANKIIVEGWEWGTHTHAQVSSDNRRIVYTRLDRGRPIATMVREISSGKEFPLPLSITHLRWSPDGEFIAGSDLSKGSLESSEIVNCRSDGTSCARLARGYYPRWGKDGSEIYFYSGVESSGRALWVMPAIGGAPRKVARLSPMEEIGPFYSVSSDGEIVWVKFEQSRSEIWVADLK